MHHLHLPSFTGFLTANDEMLKQLRNVLFMDSFESSLTSFCIILSEKNKIVNNSHFMLVCFPGVENILVMK